VTPGEATARRRTAEAFDGVPLHVWDAGPVDAPALLLLHGIGQSGLAWEPLWRSSLAEDFRLVCPDLRGHGRSGVPDDPAGLTAPAVWGGDVQAVIHALGLAAPVVVGWSYGGLVAIDHLATCGGGRALVLVCAPAGSGIRGARAFYDPGFLALAAGLGATDAATYVAAQQALVERCTAEPLEPLLTAALLGEAVRTSPATIAGVQQRSIDGRSALAGSAVPLLVVTGRRDAVVAAASGEALLSARPDGRHVELDTGHTPFIEDTDGFVDALTDFLGALPA